jgi:acetate kinase
MAILVLNAGSSSLKFAVYDEAPLREHLRGQVSGIGTGPRLQSGATDTPLPASTTYRDGLAILLDWLAGQGIAPTDIAGVGHRVVHGGSAFIAPTRIDDGVLATLDSLRSLAPLHLPFGIGVLRDMRGIWLPEVRTSPASTRPSMPHSRSSPRACRCRAAISTRAIAAMVFMD